MIDAIMIGDAYGGGFEFKASMLKYNDAENYYDHPTHMASDGSGNSLRKGQYTDDTQMSIGVMKALLSGDYSRESFAKYFVEQFKLDPRKGYASGFYAFLMEIKDGEEFLKKIRPYSDKNGSAMRVCPIGFLPSIGKVMNVAETQARVTHDTPGGIAGAKAAAVACHLLLDGVKRADIPSEVDRVVPGFEFDKPHDSKVPCNAVLTVRAALTAFTRCDNYKKLLIESVSYGGDTDSTASISMAMASCDSSYGMVIPKKLLSDVEQGDYGYDYATSLEKQLLTKLGR